MSLKNFGKGMKSILTGIDFNGIADFIMSIKPSQWAWYGIFGSVCIAITALSRQPEINKLKSANERVVSENDELRYRVRSLNHDTGVLKNKIDALKAYQFAEKAKASAQMKGCIQFQYATKEYIELLHCRRNNGNISQEDKNYIECFERIINGGKYTENEAAIIGDRIYSKYMEKIDNLIEFDCIALIDQMEKA